MTDDSPKPAKKPSRQQVYTLLVEVGRKEGDGLPPKSTGAALMIYASGVDEAEAVRETVAILKQADMAPLDVTGYGTLDERLADGQEIDEDAFLVRCEGCANSNYGATEERFVGEGKPMTGVLLLRPPQPVQPVSGAELLVHVVASGVIAGEGFELTVSAVSPPCDWQPGDEDGVPLPLGESGVTWNNCDATPDGPILWGDDGSVWTHPDPAWAEVS